MNTFKVVYEVYNTGTSYWHEMDVPAKTIEDAKRIKREMTKGTYGLGQTKRRNIRIVCPLPKGK